MAFIYEVNGQRIQFDKEPTEADIDEAARSIGKPKPESRQQKPVEGSGGAAFGVFRPQGRRPESQQDREASKEMPVQTIRGFATGTLGGPSDLLNLPGQIYGAATNQPAPYKVPLGSEEWNKMLPGQPTSPEGNLARFGGEMMSPSIIGKVIKGTVAAGKGTYDFGKGFARGMAYPEGSSPNTALAPIRPTYVPHEQVSEFMAGQRPASTLTEMPTAPLYENKPVANWAYGMSPQNQAGQKLVPYAGRTAEGIGEQIGSGYRTNPLNAAIDIGTTLATGIPAPLTAVARSAPAIAARQLQKATQFEPGFGAARQAALATEGRAGLEASMPQTPLLPAPGPVQPIPMPGPQRNVNIEGESFTLPNQIDTANSQAARPQPIQPVAPTPQQMALQKTQEIVSGKTTPNITAETRQKANDMAEQIRQRELAKQQQSWKDRAGVTMPGETPTPTPVAGPVAPTSLNKLKATLQENPPAPMTAAEEATARADMAKQQKAMTPEYRGTIVKEWIKGNQLVEGVPIDTSKKAYNGSNLVRANAQKLMKAQIDSIPVIEGVTPAQTINAMVEHLEKTNPGIFKAKKKGPSNVSKMLTGEDLPSGISSLSKEATGKIYSSKAEYDKANLFNTLQENIPRASYIEGDKLITVYPQNIPEDLMRIAGIEKMAKVIRDAKTGKVIKD